MITPYYSDDKCTIYHGDCREILPTLGTVDLILTDPPYFQVKDEDWDRQWQSADLFIDWLSGLSNLWKQRLAPNGSLYCFASPQMASRVELALQCNFNILNHLVWRKEQARHKMSCKDALRGFFPQTERIIFAEQYGSDEAMDGIVGYRDKCDEAARDVFGKYIRQIRDAHKLSSKDLTEVIGAYGKVNHGGACSNWEKGYNVPTKEHYTKIKAEWPGFFIREYEDLRREYEDLRRPFNVTQDVHYTDVWDFDTVTPYNGKHECEKPQSILRHIIEVSTKPDGLVLDSFMGSGSTLLAARDCGRKAIGIEAQEKWCEHAAQKLSQSVFLFD